MNWTTILSFARQSYVLVQFRSDVLHHRQDACNDLQQKGGVVKSVVEVAFQLLFIIAFFWARAVLFPILVIS